MSTIGIRAYMDGFGRTRNVERYTFVRSKQ